MILAQWDQVNQPGFYGTLALISIAITTLAAVVSIGYQVLKLTQELRAIKADIVSKSAETLQRLHEKRDAYNDSVDQFTLNVTELVRAIERGDVLNLDRLREACCMELTSGVFKNHFKQVDFERLYYEQNPEDMRDFIQDDLYTDLDRFTKWLNVLNHETLLEKIGGNRSPLRINLNTAKPWYRLVNALPSHWQQPVKEELWKEHLTPLLLSGASNEEKENFLGPT